VNVKDHSTFTTYYDDNSWLDYNLIKIHVRCSCGDYWTIQTTRDDILKGYDPQTTVMLIMDKHSEEVAKKEEPIWEDCYANERWHKVS